MGVLTLSSVSTFTSCKDYDDDISNLQGQIDKLATADQLSQKVAELQALISSNKSDITSLQSELAKKTTLDEVKAVLANYATKEYVDGADATLQAAIKALETGKVAELEAAVKAAQAAADKAAEDAKAANAEILETLKTLATKAEVTEVKEAAKAANDAIVALQNGDVATLKAQAEILETLKDYATKENLKEVADAAQKALDAAQKDNSKALADLDTAVKNAQSTADAAKKQAADNLASINGLATTVQNAKDALALANSNKSKLDEALESLKDSSKEGTVAAAIKAIQAQIGTPDSKLGSLASRLADIESVLNGVKDDDTKLGLATKVTNIEKQLKDIIGEYTTMVTEVSLVGSFLNNGKLNSNIVSKWDPTTGSWSDAIALQFMSGEVKKDYTFGKDEKDNTGAKMNVADQQKFVKNTPFNDKKELLVRVNPTNALITKDMVKLVNSQGNDLDGVLEIEDVKQYTDLLTRASKNTGLWKITVKVKEGVPSSKIEQLSNKGKEILFAVAIKNTKTQENADDRYVASTYDITVPKAKEFTPATNIDDVQLWSVSTMTDKGAIKLSDAKPTTSYVAPVGTTAKKVVRAKSNEDIMIDFSAYGGKVQYFYVVRDDNNTDTKSDASELNAWNSYQYDGTAYGKVVAVDPQHPGTLKINIGGKSNADDEIGFRVFAINYDGTLATSPTSGQSFVVYVGDQQNTATVGGELHATKALGNDTGWLPLTGTLKDQTSGADALPTTWTTKVGGTNLTFSVAYAKDAKGGNPSKYSDIKYIKFTLTSSLPQNAAAGTAASILYWKDNLKAEGKITTLNSKKLVENEINVSLTKVLPTVESTIALMGYKWKAAQKDNGKYTAYVYPTGEDWTSATATTGFKNMTQAINGLKAGTEFTVEGIVWNNDTKKYSDAGTFTTTPWGVTVNKALIDGTTEHKTTIAYNYGKISSEKKNNAGAVVDFVVPVETVQTVFACPLDKTAQSYAWTKKAVKDANGKVTGYEDVNNLTYGSTKTVGDVNVLEYIYGTNKFDGTQFGGQLSKLAGTKYANIEAKLISKESGNPDFFNVRIYTYRVNGIIYKGFEFIPVVNASNPLKDVESELVIKLTDAFGHNDMVYSLPFTVKRAK